MENLDLFERWRNGVAYSTNLGVDLPDCEFYESEKVHGRIYPGGFYIARIGWKLVVCLDRTEKSVSLHNRDAIRQLERELFDYAVMWAGEDYMRQVTPRSE